jgi:hypothetical protein
MKTTVTYTTRPGSRQQRCTESIQIHPLRTLPQRPGCALGFPVPEGVQWFWIRPHAEYDKFFG